MKSFLFLLLTCTTLAATEVKSLFLTEENKPTKGLIELLSLDGLYSPDDTLATLQEKTQKSWIQVVQGKEGRERCDLKDSPQEIAKKAEVIKAASLMGIFNASLPSRTHYTYAIVLGGFRDGIIFRLQELVKLWQQGVRYDTLYFLTGERTLRADKDGDLIDCKTEYDLCKLIWQKHEVPEAMRQALVDKVFFVNASRGTNARPGTKELYETWLKEFRPAPGTIVASSHPLYWTLQQLAAVKVLGPDYSLETIAPKFQETKFENNLVSVVHDTVAKCLYVLAGCEDKL